MHFFGLLVVNTIGCGPCFIAPKGPEVVVSTPFDSQISPASRELTERVFGSIHSIIEPMATIADDTAHPPSQGPTCTSPYGTASTAGGLPELSLPPPSLKETKQRYVLTELMVFMDPASGQPSPVRDLTEHSNLSANNADADADDSDAEDWMAEPDGSFSPKRKEAPTSAWKPASLMRLERSLPVLRMKLPALLILVSILLGPNLALISYLCGVSAPSGSAHLVSKPRFVSADAWRAKAHPDPSRPAPVRHWHEATGDGFWLLPAALWKRGVLLIPAMVWSA